MGDYDWPDLGRPDLPEVRVVKDGIRQIPRQRTRRKPLLKRLDGPRMRVFLSYMIGFWPLIAIVLTAGFLLWSAGYSQP